ncbi:hypothetical protein RSOLAG22IIIB_12305 [Rhizoctonia solani]|uniref:Ricin B lectin domain-containing protein n=1 Tax=Rhizoctonia solani TaxID=456999 RepID=A0A0K6GDC2_9AGAM|nr:hypothetical protein RSOLAG22IIIB_12305 [Rhizoctonia solani]
MTIPSGNYRVLTEHGKLALFIRPPGLLGTPVETLSDEIPSITVVHVKNLGEDRYILSLVENPEEELGAPVIGSTGPSPQPGQIVQIVPSGAEDTSEWRIEPLPHQPGTQNIYRIRSPNDKGMGGLGWTATGDARPIVVTDFRDEPGQRWTFDRTGN